MPQPRLPLRLILFAALAVGGAILIGLVVATLNSLLEFYQRLAELPLWLRLPLIAAVALAFGALLWLLWRLARPTSKSAVPTAIPVSRGEVDARIDALRERRAETAALEAELAELDRRRAAGEVYVALFGEISTGKSSLIRALAPEALPAIDVRGGTTRIVAHHRGRLPDGRELILADVPGSGEVDGKVHEQLARDEALRAHAVVYLCASDLTRAQDAELNWLARFGKPLLLVLNKADLYSDAERDALLRRFEQRYAAQARAVVAISAGGSERYERTLADGRREKVERERVPEIGALTGALVDLTRAGAAALEPAREAAVLAEVGRRGDELARAAAAREAVDTVAKYTRRAVVGALAAVAPGSDILIQGALGTALVRELARIHGVPVRELDVEALLARVGLTVRNTTAIVLAIAGNALKAFPGLGTLGGGVLHAIAYGLVFDSLGNALAATLAERASLDAADVEARVRALLAEPARERVERVARLAWEAARGDRGNGAES
ncbi:GTPase [Dokdonella sp.]|uniref:GTPase n=1 Tax=Dokdonella sp. TaxID=2291710 RepID=UPI001B20294D|nr:GTPase [Dokdonella sp.]MBO9664692.1 50S ribosome-binding GTPase [Dokdonella sp.]